MDTVLIGTTSDGVDVHFDRVASEADHVVVVNRIKPHTRLAGLYEREPLNIPIVLLREYLKVLLYRK